MKREGSFSGLPAYAESFGRQRKKPAITGWSPLPPTETLLTSFRELILSTRDSVPPTVNGSAKALYNLEN